ncbi:MAG: ABC transporter ATP-binding protein [Mucilaginibacter sp.]
MGAVIKVENLSKAYQLGQIGTGTLSRDLERFWAKMRGKEDPFLKIGEINDRTKKGESNIVWSLKDLNFEIEPGTAVGIIGRNGAGKSTLLKILSRVTSPTMGSVKIKGRVASLLEVGTGFHPELSGRENIFLNGAILGMRKSEIRRKFDEMVDFSGVERYIDTPVKRYSSGMYVRLAFAVAAHLESEILIVDEVLSVGDAEFQKKCLGKMGDVSKGEGRTVLFVSHNMGTVSQLCNNCMLLNNGSIIENDKTAAVIERYYDDLRSFNILKPTAIADVFFEEAFTCDRTGKKKINFAHSDDIVLRLKIAINNFSPMQNIGLGFLSRDKKRVFTINKSLSDLCDKRDKEIIVEFTIPGGLIAPNEYSFLLALNTKTGLITYNVIDDACPITVYDDGTELSFAEGLDYGSIIVKDTWNLLNSLI